MLKALAEVIPEKSRVLYAVTIGINPSMKFGYGQDRFPAGSVGLVTAFAGILRTATLKVGGDTLVRAGNLK